MSDDQRFGSNVLTPVVTDWQKNSLRKDGQPPYGGGSGDGGDMNERIARLEAGHQAILRELDQRFTQVDQRFTQVDQRFNQLDGTLAAIRADIANLASKSDVESIGSKQLNRWDVAKVVGAVIGFSALLLLLGPRMLSMLAI